MLLGREAINGRYLVDPSKSFCQGDYTEEGLKEKYSDKIKPKTGLTIGILASNPELYSNKRIIEAGEARGHKMVFLNVVNTYMKLDAGSPEIRYRGGSILDKFDAVIPRIKPSVTFYACALLRQFDNLGVYCLNSAQSITHSRDKLYASQLFSKNKHSNSSNGLCDFSKGYQRPDQHGRWSALNHQIVGKYSRGRSGFGRDQ